MKKLDKLNSHKRDSRINFNEKEHSYTIDDQEKAISVTQLIHEFFPKFDKNYWAERESNKTGESKDDILSRWEELGSKARNLGTELHNQIENYYNDIDYQNSREFEKFISFHDKYINKNYEPYRTEWRVFDQNKLFSLEEIPFSISLVSSLIFIMASQNLFNSFNDSLSVGSIINVPATGQDIVGA